jgi:preprotein translocase subunit YajC
MTPAICLFALQGAPAGQSQLFALWPMILIFGVFYLVLFLPMRRRQKALQQLVDNLKRGDKVVTNGGLYGEVYAVEGTVVQLKVSDNVRVRIAKSAIAGLEGDPAAEEKK